MANPRIRVHYPGVGEMLKSAPVADAVTALARQVAGTIQAEGHVMSDGPLPVEVSAYTTDRAAAAVVVPHPAALGLQAKYGLLTRAAAAAGLEVRGG